jgi:RNA polymerase sigma factor (sigma-70 family)
MSELPVAHPRLHLADDGAGPVPQGVADDTVEREILREVAGGNYGRFDVLVNRHKTRMFRFLYLRLGDLDAAEDLTQEVFLRLFRAGPNADANGRVSTWLFTIARNCLVDHVRGQRRRERMHNALLRLTPRDSALDPVTAAAFQEERVRVAGWLKELPEEQGEVLSLRFFGDLTVPEIAEVTGANVATVKSRLRYGLSKMASILAREAQS